jgi:hypothetical protein
MVPIPSGTWKVVVHVAPKKRNVPALIRPLDGKFPGGGSRRLEIYLSKSADLTAQLI